MGEDGSGRSSARQRGSKVLHGFANALLERGLPRIRTWLRERLGPDADLANLRLDGPRVHMEGAHLPLGGRAHLQVEKATILLLSKGVTSPKLRLHALRGAVRVDAEDSHFEAPVTLVDEGDDDDAWVHGTLEVKGASWTTTHGVGEQAPLDGRVAVRVTLRRWALSDGHFTSGDSAMWLSADGAMDNNTEQRALRRARLVFREARAGHLIDALRALTGLAPPEALPLPFGSLLTGELSWTDEGTVKLNSSIRGDEPLSERCKLPEELRIDATIHQRDDGLAGEVSLESAGTSVKLSPLSYREGLLDGSRLSGTLALNEAVALGLFPSAIHPSGRGSIVADLSLAGAAANPRLRGRINAEIIELVAAQRPSTPPLPFHDATAELELSRERMSLHDLHMTGFGARLDAAASFAFTDVDERPPMMTMSFVDAPAELAEAAARLAGGPEQVMLERDGKRPDEELWIPKDARFSGELELAASLALSGQLAVETTTSAVMLQLCLSPEQRLDGSRLRGRLSAADTLRVGLLSGPIRPIEGIATLDAGLDGALSSPRLTGQAHAKPMRLDVAVMGLSCEELSLRFRIDHESITWSHLEAKAWGGLVESDGVLVRSLSGGALEANFEVQRLGVAQIPLGRSNSTLGQYLAGTASGRLRLQRRGQAPLSGIGDLTIREPHYRFIRLTRDKLREVGLPLPPERGTGPLTANLDIDDDGLRVTELEADVEGCRLDAQGDIGFDGSLAGEARLRLAEAYLRESALLIVPAAFTGSVNVPMTLAGTLTSPKLDADMVAVLSDAFRLGKVGSAVSGAMGGMRNAMDGVADKVDDFIGTLSGAFGAGGSRPRDDDDLEKLVDRIMADDPDTDGLIDRLIDAGVSSEDIVRILEQRRMRFRGD